jgi:hypothetical protein
MTLDISAPLDPIDGILATVLASVWTSIALGKIWTGQRGRD